MHITILQHNIDWCQVDKNLAHLDALTAPLPKTDLLLLPEMFATGLNNAAIDIVDAQPRILAWMQQKAKAMDAAIVGSIATEDSGRCYNRLHFVRPDGSVSHYDKRHLFAYGGEAENYTAGHERVIVEWRGVRFLLQVCYDLRYPLWARQRGDYDCILYSANFPISRDTAWRLANAHPCTCHREPVLRGGLQPHRHRPAVRVLRPLGHHPPLWRDHHGLPG